jgi:geranylgeranyl diphosphate synthase, type I
MNESFFKQLPQIKKQISHALTDFLGEKKKDLAISARSSEFVFDHLAKFAISGKYVRGGFFYYLADSLGFKDKKIILKLSAAIELAHTANVIQSDVFMNETFSRYQDTTWVNFLKKEKPNFLPENTSKSIAILTADLAFILATELFKSAVSGHKNREKIINRFLLDFSHSKLGQVEKYFLAGKNINPTEREIIDIFSTEIAKYTFSLPFFMAASMTNQTNKFISDFSELGEIIGIIFKIREDDVSFYIESDKMGRTMGLDSEKNIRNLIHHCFYKKCSSSEKKFLDKVYGKSPLSLHDKEKMKELYVPTGAYPKVCKIKSIYTDKALKIIKNIKINSRIKTAIMDLLIYSISRIE